MEKNILPKQCLRPFLKTIMYVLLFVIVPALFIVLCLDSFTFREAFMQGILFLIFLLAKGCIFLSCLKLTNKWYLISDAFFIAVFAGLYHFVEHSDRHLVLLFFTVYITCIHFFLMAKNIMHEGFASLKENVLNTKHLFQERMANLVDVVKPIEVYIRNNDQMADNLSINHDIDIELVTKRFFNSIDNKEFPVTSKEIIKIYKKLNINIFKQRYYNKSDFLNILITLNFVKSKEAYNSLRRPEDSKLKEYLLGGNPKKLLQVIAILKNVECAPTCDEDMYDYWITTESSLN